MVSSRSSFHVSHHVSFLLMNRLSVSTEGPVGGQIANTAARACVCACACRWVKLRAYDPSYCMVTPFEPSQHGHRQHLLSLHFSISKEAPFQPTKVHGPENHVASNLAGLGICCAAVSAYAENVRASHKLRLSAPLTYTSTR